MLGRKSFKESEYCQNVSTVVKVQVFCRMIKQHKFELGHICIVVLKRQGAIEHIHFSGGYCPLAFSYILLFKLFI